jgi:hypothetical protein
MVDDQDWKAAISSEVFRNYVMAQLQQEVVEEANRETEEQKLERETAEMDQALTAMEQLEQRIKRSPQLMARFRIAKAALLNHPELADKVDPNFVKGIMMLDLPEED